jgi:hypothetical protein
MSLSERSVCDRLFQLEDGRLGRRADWFVGLDRARCDERGVAHAPFGPHDEAAGTSERRR